MTNPTHLARCQQYMQVARAFSAAGRPVPSHILGMLAKSVPVWKEWSDVPHQVRSATKLYWDVRNRTKEQHSAGT